MSIFDRRRPSASKATVELALPAVLQAMEEAVYVFEHAEIDAALLRAQLADRCRDAGVEPASPDGFDAAVHGLDVEGWRRLSAVASLWTWSEVGVALASILRQRGAETILAAMLTVVRAKPLLTMAVMRVSALRTEELARASLGALGIGIAGESAAQSAAALTRLDYERVLAQAEQARQAAEGRMAQLKQAQEVDDMARNPRRGKS
jgi:hypothetical protein